MQRRAFSPFEIAALARETHSSALRRYQSGVDIATRAPNRLRYNSPTRAFVPKGSRAGHRTRRTLRLATQVIASDRRDRPRPFFTTFFAFERRSAASDRPTATRQAACKEVSTISGAPSCLVSSDIWIEARSPVVRFASAPEFSRQPRDPSPDLVITRTEHHQKGHALRSSRARTFSLNSPKVKGLTRSCTPGSRRP
jgi:hypothetical protein